MAANVSQFRRQLDANIEKMAQNIAGILRSSKITTETASYQQSLQISSHTTNLLQAAEALMRQIQELKLSIMLQDLEALKAETDKNVANIEQRFDGSEKEIKKLTMDVKDGMETVINGNR